MSGLVNDGDYIILDENGEKRSIHHMRSNISVKIGKSFLNIGHLIGTPWGATYQLSADGTTLHAMSVHTSIIGPKVSEIDKDNSQLCDENQANQALTHEQIEAMKAQGKAGEDIVQALCQSSATFEGKTEFAQDKYKKRKARKYLVQVTIRRPTACLLCQSMYDKGPARIWNLRSDTLAIMMSLANIGAYSRVLLLESCQGLLAAAVAERLGGYGRLCCTSVGPRPAPLDCVRSINLKRQAKDAICCAPLADLLAAKANAGPAEEAAPAAEAAAAEEVAEEEEAAAGSSHPPDKSQQQQQQEQEKPGGTERAGPGPPAEAAAAVSRPVLVAAAVAAEDDGNIAEAGLAEPRAEEAAAACDRGEDGLGEEMDVDGPHQQQQQEAENKGARQHTYTASPELVRQMAQAGFSSCIIAAPKLQPLAAVQTVLPLLAPSASFVVYSPWSQPLAEAMQQLSSSKQAVMLQLQESWLRPHQVLPGRSHPHMNMTTGGTGGYILSGVVVDNTTEPPKAAEGPGDSKQHTKPRGRPPKRGRR